tara:strand:+ start:173 stop:472 length:300 start_codon:yes stop_codon:yes gene_type:complete
MSKEKRLPHDFDLHYDIKYMKEVEAVANDEPHASDATPEDLVELFIAHKMEIPECLRETKEYMDNRQTIWILPDGTWLDYEPLTHEHPEFRKVQISKFK